MGGVCSSHGLSPIALLGFDPESWVLVFGESGNGGVLWEIVACLSSGFFLLCVSILVCCVSALCGFSC